MVIVSEQDRSMIARTRSGRKERMKLIDSNREWEAGGWSVGKLGKLEGVEQEILCHKHFIIFLQFFDPPCVCGPDAQPPNIAMQAVAPCRNGGSTLQEFRM